MRDRLIELLNKARCKEVYTTSDGEPVTKINRRIVDMYEVNILADYLLANGVIVPPCKVGDTVYVVDKGLDVYWQGTVVSVCYSYNEIEYGISFNDGDFSTYNEQDVFLAKEEVEQALKGGNE